MLRTALPRANLLQFEQSGPDGGFECRALEAFGFGELPGIDRTQPARERAEVADLPVDGPPAQILEKIVMNVHTVEGGTGRMCFVEVPEVLVDEMGKGFG
jgi:hypothetical protein